MTATELSKMSKAELADKLENALIDLKEAKKELAAARKALAAARAEIETLKAEMESLPHLLPPPQPAVRLDFAGRVKP